MGKLDMQQSTINNTMFHLQANTNTLYGECQRNEKKVSSCNDEMDRGFNFGLVHFHCNNIALHVQNMILFTRIQVSDDEMRTNQTSTN